MSPEIQRVESCYHALHEEVQVVTDHSYFLVQGVAGMFRTGKFRARRIESNYGHHSRKRSESNRVTKRNETS